MGNKPSQLQQAKDEAEKELKNAKEMQTVENNGAPSENSEKLAKQVADAETKLHRVNLKINLEKAEEDLKAAENRKADKEEMRTMFEAKLAAQAAFDKEEEDRKREEALNPDNMDDYTRKQRELNDLVKVCKEALAKTNKLKGSRVPEDIEEGVRAKKDFAKSMRSANRVWTELNVVQKKEYSREMKLEKTQQNTKSKQELQERSQLCQEFRKQMDQLADFMTNGVKARARPKPKKAAVKVPGIPPDENEQEADVGAVDSSQLDMLPDLDPSSYAQYQEFTKNDEEVEEMLSLFLGAAEAVNESAEQVADESKIQNELCDKQHAAVGEAVETAKEANEKADDLLEDLDSTPWCKIACYVFNLLAIGGGGYYIYSEKFS